MKLQDIFEAIVDLDDDAEDLIRKPFVPTNKFHRAMDTTQLRRVGTDRGSENVKKDTDREVKQAAGFLRDILLKAFSGRKRTTFDPITYEQKRIRIKVAIDHNVHPSEKEAADLNALAEYLGSEGGVKMSRDLNHKYVTVMPAMLVKWMDDSFPTTEEEINGSEDRVFDPYARKVPRSERELKVTPRVEEPAPTRKLRRVTKDEQRQEKVDAAKRAKDDQLAWEFERTRKAREKAARAAELKAELASAKQKDEADDKLHRMNSSRKGWGK